MQYLLMIYDDEQLWDRMGAEQSAALLGEYHAFTRDLVASGHMQGGNALEPTRTATTVRVRDGKIVTTDGPFAETKEQLGGYYLVEARDLDQAIALAARIPSSRFGSVEIRPIMTFPDAR
jgi:hypothetical protein